MKKCTRCGKSYSEFYAKESRCKSCVNELRKIKYLENPQKHRERTKSYRDRNPEKIRDTKLRQAYGVGIDYFNSKLLEQNGVCAGCGQNRKTMWRGKLVEMALDHDHQTNEPRGILCIKCNRALGLLEEKESTLLSLVGYINKYKKSG